MAAGVALRTRIVFGSRFTSRLPQRREREWSKKKMGVGCCRLYSEAPDRTTVKRLDVIESVRAPYVSKYSTEGFNIRGNRVVGSVALLPTAFLHWAVNRFEEITPESLTLFAMVHPQIEVLVLGVGARVQRVPENVKTYLRSKAIALEVSDTPNACATFNFLLDEGRQVGAALIPPEFL